MSSITFKGRVSSDDDYRRLRSRKLQFLYNQKEDHSQEELQNEIAGSLGQLGRLPFTPTTQAKAGGIQGLSQNDIIIVVLGPTGSGKSTFINIATGLDTKVGHNLESGTRIINPVRLSFPEDGGRDIVLVDTPGFDDTNKTDAEILAMITAWWMDTYHQHITLSGLLYFHRISDNRIGGTSLKNLDMFKKLCGENPLEKIILMTTMWDQVDEETGATRYQDLQKDYWSEMSERGTTARFMGTRESALSILTPFILKAIQGKVRLSLSSTTEAKVVEKESLLKKDIIIAIMGPTGSGKSTFINIATGLDVGIGHTLESCTSTVNTIKLSFPEYSECNVVFVDTPGFDDTNKSDAEILKMIADWLNETYRQDIYLSGLLYFHRISDNRMGGTPAKNLEMFKALCGTKRLKNVILTTTMWDEVDEATGNARETELKNNYWRKMIDHQSKTARFKNTRESAFKILGPLIDEAKSQQAVLIQEEMVDMKLQLRETSAGQAFYEKMSFLVAQRQEMLRHIREELKRPDLDETSMQLTRVKYQNLQKDLDRALGELRGMKLPIGHRLVLMAYTAMGWGKDLIGSNQMNTPYVSPPSFNPNTTT
ncbi:P-loop containing nucleoside triphosphate hydrolase protein [Crassisporium funariophilum]|nr:P-loop containing nucleoside triphosphate hydrolase protein [Crassisporium funariophilum]